MHGAVPALRHPLQKEAFPPMLAHALAILLALLAVPGAPNGAPAEEPARAEARAHFDTAEQLLEALERADADIRTFRSELAYDRRMTLQGDIQVRYGNLYFDARRPDPRNQAAIRTFGIHFHTLIFDDQYREEPQTWVFNGEWLVEKRPREKQYIARQIAEPGSGIDPLRLGEGPLPIPIGQKKDDILARYEARLLPVADGFDPDDETTVGYADFVRSRSAQQIMLTPREASRDADDFRNIRLWYAFDAEGRLLPILSRTLDRKGDEVFVQLYSIVVNEPLPAGVTEIDPPPDARETGWHVQIERRVVDR